MIATLRGEVTQIEGNALILEVGGVGLRVFVPAPVRTRLKAGEVILLYTHLVVREDALTLYGFESQGDRELFHTLLGVDGVGPKVALSVLSTMTLDAIQRAVFGDEGEILSRVPGVGKKTAQKMALHMKDKLKPADALSRVAAPSDTDGEVLAALTALVYSVLLDRFGFDTVDAGPLKEGWRIQRDTPGYGPRRTAEELRRDLAAAKRYADR